MGGCFSEERQPANEAHPLRSAPRPFVIPLSDIETLIKPYFFALPKDQKAFKIIQNEHRAFYKFYSSLQVFETKQELLDFKFDNKQNNILVIECQSTKEAQNIRQLPNFHIFTQIAVICKKPLIEDIKSVCPKQLGFRFKTAIQLTQSEMSSFFEETIKVRSIYFYHKDQGLINRAHLIMDYFFRRQVNYDNSLFEQWAKSISGGEELIKLTQMLRQGDVRKIMEDYILENIMRQDSIIFKAIDMLRRTSNPGILIHTARPCSILFNFIKEQYFRVQLWKSSPILFYVWVQLTQSQQNLLEKSNGENFMFPSFVAGYTSKQKAPKADRAVILYEFNIIIDIKSPYDSKVDQGFYFSQDRVIFNLQTTFHLTNVDTSTKTATATYCSIGPEYNQRLTNDRYSWKKDNQHNQRMVKLYERYFHNRLLVRNELDLFVALQYYHLFKEVARSYPLTQQIYQKLGDCEKELRNWDAAADCYDKITDLGTKIFKKLLMYYPLENTNERAKFVKTMAQLQRNKNTIQRNSQRNTAFELFYAVLKQRKGQKKNSKKKILQCNPKVSEIYQRIRLAKDFYQEDLNCFSLYLLASRINIAISDETNENFAKEKEELASIEKYYDGVHLFLLEE